eukprot:gnl/MRDRNA2_/MRDRNA2_85398_c0_seq2.p1 gnl/MRDRNA2_/MRDRNA2_85398_c0~~gnl/MRDRNA2_/MRDRNA2_85398_c0_seq2.p1  ORF type:complete len:146 (+),score=8.65 gnl/MRDRNA2_/MRDRNA2_85398_c0_seq2:374-811(+)
MRQPRRLLGVSRCLSARTVPISSGIQQKHVNVKIEWKRILDLKCGEILWCIGVELGFRRSPTKSRFLLLFLCVALLQKDPCGPVSLDSHEDVLSFRRMLRIYSSNMGWTILTVNLHLFRDSVAHRIAVRGSCIKISQQVCRKVGL